MGNVGSVINMLTKVGATALASTDPEVLRRADKLVLPGVGAFDAAMSNLRSLGLVGLLSELVLERQTPILGICLGMQIMGRASEEGRCEGLSWFDAVSRKFVFDPKRTGLRVPHMGWNLVRPCKQVPLINAMPDKARFYFVHSYHVCCEQPSDVMLGTNYGIEFASGIQRGNIYGVQFHPEKSHRYGMALMRSFVEHG